MIAAHLKLQPGQGVLTPEQRAEARRFAQDWVAAQLSTEPINEDEAEYWLRLACQKAEIPPPQEIVWLDSPLQLVWLWSSPSLRPVVWASAQDHVQASRWDRVKSLPVILEDNGFPSWGTFGGSLWATEEPDLDIADQVKEHVRKIMSPLLWRLDETIRRPLEAALGPSLPRVVWECLRDPDAPFGLEYVVGQGYYDANHVVVYRFFDEYLAANDFSAWAHFIELVSGYHLSNTGALVIRRPQILSRDAEGRLHSETGKCLEYRDGWGFYAWHGVLVPERVILRPETLTRDDFLSERNIEVRRAIQERMGERFVPELGGQVIDAGSRGTLYEVELPNDPERVARYVQVQDASTQRRYYLRVPPSIQTADEAVAWSFGRSVEEYAPARET